MQFLENIVYKTAAVLFGGIGGSSAGLMRSQVEYGGKLYRFKLLCSIDSDPIACLNHDVITGTKTARVMDLFTRDQYMAWHGEEPPSNWKEVTAWDMWVAFGYQVPFFLFTSPPCKGLSGLLPEKSAKTQKYQALNQLTVRGIELSLRACLEFGGEVPAIIQLENVPRILSRGKSLLKQIEKTLKKYGYAISMRADHNLGEVGGLGQNRVRFLIMARHEAQIPNFIFYPEKKPLKTIGDIIGPLPMPGDTEAGGPLNRLPRLARKSWEKLAAIPAGGDWRDLNKFEWQKYRLTHEPRGGAWAVEEWSKSSRTVTGGAGVGRSNGAAAISDPRVNLGNGSHSTIYRMVRWEEPGPTVTGACGPNNGAISISDPRLKERDGRHPGVYRIVRADETASCVTGTRFGSGALADLRVDKQYHNGTYKVTDWENTSPTVTTGSTSAGSGKVIADPRVKTKLMPDSYGVQDWDEAGKTVRGASRIMNSPASISDPRLSDLKNRYSDKYRMQNTGNPAATVTGVTDVQAGAPLVADPRLKCTPRAGSYGVQDWNETGKTVTGSADIHSGASAVADPRIPEPDERCVMIIIAPDGTWHRPLTTFELAMLQSFPQYLPDGRPFQLEGCSDAKAREYIGNAVPRDAAEENGNVVLLAAAEAVAGISFTLSWDPIWVAPATENQVTLLH